MVDYPIYNPLYHHRRHGLALNEPASNRASIYFCLASWLVQGELGSGRARVVASMH